MGAQTFKLNSTPQQILDGTKAGYVQEIKGSKTRFTCTTTTPNPSTTPYCQILKNDFSIGAGFPVWAWSGSGEIEITVLTAEG